MSKIEQLVAIVGACLIAQCAYAQETIAQLESKLRKKESELRNLRRIAILESEIDIIRTQLQSRHVAKGETWRRDVTKPNTTSPVAVKTDVDQPRRTWSGAYTGILASFGTTRPHWRQVPQCFPSDGCNIRSLNPTFANTRGGLSLGVVQQFQSIVIGADVSLFLGHNKSEPLGFYQETPPFWNGAWDPIRFRHTISERNALQLNSKIGFVVDGLWLYGIGGAAVSRFGTQNVQVVAPPSFYGRTSHYQFGPSVGFGVEFPLADQWTVAANIIHTSFRRRAYRIHGSDGLGDDSYVVTMRPIQNSITIGLRHKVQSW